MSQQRNGNVLRRSPTPNSKQASEEASGVASSELLQGASMRHLSSTQAPTSGVTLGSSPAGSNYVAAPARSFRLRGGC